MGLRARILQVIQSKLARYLENPGQSVVVQLQSNAGELLQVEAFQPPGLAGMPPAGAKAIVLQLGDSPSQAVVIALQNYQVTISVAQGEVMLYSTTADGKTLKATVKLDAAGNVTINGGSNGAARNGDATLANATTDSTFWTFLQAVATFCSLGSAPSSLTGKVNAGSSTVKVG